MNNFCYLLAIWLLQNLSLAPVKAPRAGLNLTAARSLRLFTSTSLFLAAQTSFCLAITRFVALPRAASHSTRGTTVAVTSRFLRLYQSASASFIGHHFFILVTFFAVPFTFYKLRRKQRCKANYNGVEKKSLADNQNRLLNWLQHSPNATVVKSQIWTHICSCLSVTVRTFSSGTHLR